MKTNVDNETKLTDDEIDLLNGFDGMVLNNGLFSWCVSRMTIELPEYVKLLRKRDSELDRKVADIFIESVALHTVLNRDRDELEAIKTIAEQSVIDSYEKIIFENQKKFDACEKSYESIAKEFMESYGLNDYAARFNEFIRSKDIKE